MTTNPNANSITQFYRYIAERKPALKKQYEQLLAQDLSRQQSDGCFQRNVLAVLAQVYDQALTHLKTLPFDSAATLVNQGLSELTQQVLAAFDGFVDDFLAFVVDKHRTSCALSNFPDEHKPDKAYVNEVKREIAGLWQNFALNVNAYFLKYR
jgi:monoamine oxidase